MIRRSLFSSIKPTLQIIADLIGTKLGSIRCVLADLVDEIFDVSNKLYYYLLVG